jgi:hypothetical protein
MASKITTSSCDEGYEVKFSLGSLSTSVFNVGGLANLEAEVRQSRSELINKIWNRMALIESISTHLFGSLVEGSR